ncbi:MAG: L-threonylcarbamoyladenylate synthase [Gammaproteobacteria bacterium]
MSVCPSAFQIKRAVQVLQQGGIIGYPTEAVFGLGCDPLNPQAIHRLLAIKQRAIGKGLILIAADLASLKPFLLPINKNIQKQLAATWPGHTTWILPARPDCPRWLTGDHDTLAVRLSAHPVCRALCTAWQGPLVSTSANRSNFPPIQQKHQLIKQFAHTLEYIVPGDLGHEPRPSTIRTPNNIQPIRD